LAMDEPGGPLANVPAAETNFAAEQLRDVGSDIPTGPLSRMAQRPVAEVTARSRSAKDAQLYRTASPSVVYIATKDGFGSGSLIGPFGEVVTNWHVVKKYGEVAVVFKPSTEGQTPGKDDILTGFVVKYDEVADLALVKIPNAPDGTSFLSLGDASEIGVD